MGCAGRLGDPEAEMEGAGDQFPILPKGSLCLWGEAVPGLSPSPLMSALAREPRMSTIQFLKNLPLLLSPHCVRPLVQG